WLISITHMPVPCQSSISAAAVRSTGSGSTAGPGLKLKMRMAKRECGRESHYRVTAHARLRSAKIARAMLVRLALLFTVALGQAMAAPRAEVQVALCEPFDDVSRKLELTVREAPYETWQFDDARLTLLERGVRVRLRMKARGGELTVKIADR